MASVFKRGNVYWCKLKQHGKWINKSTECSDEGEAKRYAKQAQKVLDRNAGAEPGASIDSGTVRAFALDTWIPRRRELDLDWKNDQSRLQHHVLPVIGDKRVDDVRAPDIAQLFHKLRTTKLESTGEKPSQRTVYNIYSVVAALFRDAQLDGKIEASPCVLTNRQLGPLVDKDPEWRDGSVFTRDEAEILISHPEIPFDRQLYYGFGLLAGMRPGEIAAVTWANYDSAMEPLGRLTVAHAYNTRKSRVAGTKTLAVRQVPVHPTLAAMLAEWKLSGWESMMGRKPEPGDLILPLPPEASARRRSRHGEAYRSGDYAAKRWREEDHPMLGWRYREPYATKSTFISLVLEDGADDEVIESRVTHTKHARRAFDGYDRARDKAQWPRTCDEVAKLQLTRRDPSSFGTALGTVVEFPSRKMVEAAGVEPASEDASEQTSTRVGTLFKVSGSPAAAGLRAQQAD